MKGWLVWVAWTLLSCPALRADLVVVQKVQESGTSGQTAEITLKVKGEKTRKSAF